MRVYGARDQIHKYAFFTIYVTALLVVWFAVGTWNALVGSLMITLYLSWSPWHYSGQNYGIALMFMGRAGVAVSATAKWARWLSFVLSFVLTLINLNLARPLTQYRSGVGETELGFMPAGLPVDVMTPLFILVLCAYLVSIAVAATLLLRGSTLRALLPAAMIVGSQSLWFVVPYSAMQFPGPARDGATGAFLQNAILWVAIAHAAQYLWITSYYARGTSEWRGYGSYFVRTFAFSSVVWTLPVIIFAPYALGGASFEQGLVLLMAALVNLHHFVLDGAIWKLRNSRIASVLIRDESDASGVPRPYAKAIELSPRAARAHAKLGRMLVEDGEFDAGIAHLEQTLQLMPTHSLSQKNLDAAISRKQTVGRLERGGEE